MDTKSKILLATLILVTITAIGFTFWKTVVKQDFEIRTDIPAKE
jgi:hypothetical protein